jgi:hypothetical protein
MAQQNEQFGNSEQLAQQTAVDWLFDKLDVIIELDSTKWDKIAEVVAKAKEMEKQQHEETALSIAEILLDKLEGKNDLPSKELFEQYYNETYGKVK